jgi:hypothetical protein
MSRCMGRCKSLRQQQDRKLKQELGVKHLPKSQRGLQKLIDSKGK